MENKTMQEMMNEMMNTMMQQMAQQMMMTMMQNMMNQFSTGSQSLAPSTQVSESKPVEKTDNHVNAAVAAVTTSVKCKWGVEKINLDGNKTFWRITDGIFTAGKWQQSKYDANKEYRIPTNQEAHRIATNKIKALDGIQSINPNGAEWKAYGFSSKKKAEEAIKHLPEKIDRAEIAAYISEHGSIKAKAVVREKK